MSESKNSENKEKYIKEVRESDLEKPGDEDMIGKIMQDFSDNNDSITREDLLKKFNECQEKAKEKLMSENS